jgi:uncharacterized membrane protein
VVRVEHSVVINRPLEDVFAFAADFGNDARWSAAVKVSERTFAGPLGVGAGFRQVTELLGQRIEASGTVTEFEPNRAACYASDSGPIPHRDCRVFEAVEGGTQVTMAIEAQLSGVYRMAEPMIRSAGLQQLRGDLERLKRMLESETDGLPDVHSG